MLSKLMASRWKHVIRLVPLGTLVGLIIGYFFKDILYGLLIGCTFGALLGLMFAIRNAQ